MKNRDNGVVKLVELAINQQLLLWQLANTLLEIDETLESEHA